MTSAVVGKGGKMEMTDREMTIKGIEVHVDPNISCADCPYWHFRPDCFSTLWSDVAELLRTQPKWISVGEKLPEEHESIFYKLLGTPKWSNSMWKQESEKVLVYVSFPDGTGVVTTGCLHNSDWMTTISKALPQTVTHWMPLPKPPKEDA